MAEFKIEQVGGPVFQISTPLVKTDAFNILNSRVERAGMTEQGEGVYKIILVLKETAKGDG